MSTLLNGTELAQKIKDHLKKFISEHHLEPQLGIILVGEDPASQLYVSLKEKACKEIGIGLHTYKLASITSQEKLHEVMEFLNNDAEIDGILLQLPLPKGLNEDAAVALMDSNKDVDGFHPNVLEGLMKHEHHNFPGLVEGILQLIDLAGQNLEDKKALIISNSEIFAQPLEHALVHSGMKVKIIKHDDANLKSICQEADVIISAVGKKWFIDKDMVHEGAILIDVGTTREDDKTYGDINPNVDEKNVFRSPVPGGVGPMTIAMLLKNVVQKAVEKAE